MTEELKPCPFCGGPATHEPCGDIGCAEDGCGVVAMVYCFGDHENTVERWNKRPIEDGLRAENERLRGALERILKESIDCDAREIAEQMLAHGR